MRSNFRHLYADIFWYGVLAGSAVAFLAVYATHLGATGFQIGLLTAGPAVVNLLVSLPGGHWLERRPVIRATFATSLWHRAGYLILLPLPWFFAQAGEVWALVLIVVFMSIPGTLLAISFNAMFADVVPPEWRGHVVGRRNALVAVGVTGASLICGQLLDRIAFPLNYQIVFTIGVLGAALSSYHLGRIRLPDAAARPPRVGRALNDAAGPGLLRIADALRQGPGLRFLTRAAGRRLLRLDLLRGSFGPFLTAYFMFYTVQHVAIPLYPLFWVRQLHLTDGEISVGQALFHAAMLLVSLRLRVVTQRFGHHRVLVAGAALNLIYPLLTGLALDARLFWAASVAGGAVWALANGGLVNRLMERVPEDDRPAHMALHNLALNLGLLAGALLGPLLGDWLGLREALFISAGLRLLGGVLLWVWG